MTREETSKILAIIGATYPAFKVQDKKSTVDAWMFFLEGFSYSDISIALKTYVYTSGKGFPPSVDQLITLVNKPKEYIEMTEGQAWSLVANAIGRSIYYADEEFEKLKQANPAIAKAVGAPSQLRQWAMDENLNMSVVSSNFMRSYRIVTEREREIAKLPGEVVNRIKAMQLDALPNKEEKIC